MKEVRRSSLIALTLLASACGSTDPALGDAFKGDQDNNLGSGGRRDAGPRDAGRDAGNGKDDDDDGDDGRKDGSTGPLNCGRSTFTTGSVIPDMLIALDRSGSMRPGGVRMNLDCRDIGPLEFTRAIECAAAGIDCNNANDQDTIYCGGTQTRGPVDRWTPSVAAVKTLTSRFDQEVAFGLMTFPARRNECGPGDFPVPVNTGTAGEIAEVLDNTSPGGGTPTGQTLQAALQAFKETETGADTIQAARYVLLVTDGQPTCPNSNGASNDPRDLEADKQLTIEALDELREYGVKTFVVGYDAQLDPALAQSLTEFAQHGGTDMYYPVQNEESLITAFESISETVVTCAFQFKEQITDPSLLRVTLDDVTLKPNDPNGWVLDGQTITIQGESCQMLNEERRNHAVEIVLECEPVVYI